MRFPRSSGILLHVSSLPGPFGIGDFGPEAYQFVDFLVDAEQSIWQVLPLGPPAVGNSPYSCYSAFAGNPLFISPERLVKQGLLRESELPEAATGDTVDFHGVTRSRQQMLERSFRHYSERADTSLEREFTAFREEHAPWLEDFSLFAALRRQRQGLPWSDWELPLVQRNPNELEAQRSKNAEAIQFERYVQFLFFRQWRELKQYANQRGLEIFGDMPLFVAHDSADVWVHQDLFGLDRQGRPQFVSGVPPDAFSETGQIWNNPLFCWDALAATDYAWWVERIEYAFRCFDLLRIDHFRGLESYWEIPAGEPTAMRGRWVKGPGAACLDAAQRRLGPLKLVAEDLGIITDEVHELREQLGLPGMRVLQFGFGAPDDLFHRPESFPEHCVAYTGTHDNDTVVGWLDKLTGVSKQLVAAYLEGVEDAALWELIQRVMRSQADTAIFPMQDLLGLSDQARMNTPGLADGNWGWRMRTEQLSTALGQRLRELTAAANRSRVR